MRKKTFGILVLTVVFVIAFGGCSKKSFDTKDTASSMVNEAADYTNGVNQTTKTELADGKNQNTDVVEDVAESEAITNSSALSASEAASNTIEKIIKNVYLEVETKNFDLLITTIDEDIKKLGGYTESSEINGTYYYSDNLKSGNIVARIPKDKLEEFVSKVSKESNVVNKQESSENITLEYVDTQSHKAALEIEQERLLALLEKAKKLEDIITLEERLTNIRYELQNYESQLRTYDNRVNYSTVTIDIQEVIRMTNVIEKESVWSRIRTGFSNTMYNLTENAKDFVVWFVVNLPYLIIWAFIILIFILIIIKYYRKNNKNDKSKENAIKSNKSNSSGEDDNKKET